MLLKSLKYSLLILLSLAGEAPASAKVETWVEVRSPHFRVVANSSEKDARRVTIQFERMRSVFQKAFPSHRIDPSAPIASSSAECKRGYFSRLTKISQAREK